MHDACMAATPLNQHGAPEIGPREAGAQLVSLFDTAKDMPDKVQWAVRESWRRLGGAPDPAIAAACGAIAAAMDGDGPAFDRPPYHNRQHVCEVLLTTQLLCTQNAVAASDGHLVLLAALMHDLGHDGRVHAPFQMEKASLALARPALDSAGVDAQTQLRLGALVLATSLWTGASFAAAAHRFHQFGDPAPAASDQPPELHELLLDARLARLAALLCEADVLPSVGLTEAHSLRLQRRLSAEWGEPLGMLDKLAFIDDLLAHGLIGAFFLPNVQALAQRYQSVQLVGVVQQR